MCLLLSSNPWTKVTAGALPCSLKCIPHTLLVARNANACFHCIHVAACSGIHRSPIWRLKKLSPLEHNLSRPRLVVCMWEVKKNDAPRYNNFASSSAVCSLRPIQLDTYYTTFFSLFFFFFPFTFTKTI